jgi:isopropylmalate/homocitrate/citramalate synthase
MSQETGVGSVGNLKEELEFDEENMTWHPTLNRIARENSGRSALTGPVTLCDETLREGEETPGVYLDLAGRMRIARKLEEIGVPEIEVGYVGAIQEHFDLSRQLKSEKSSLKLVSHTRTYTKEDEWKVELDRAVEAGSDILCLLASGSHTLAATTPWLPLSAVPERVAMCIEYTKRLGVYPALTLVDGIRTPLKHFIRIYEAAFAAGVERIYVMDGQGVALPETIAYLVRLARAITGPGCEIAVHCHNDYGLATANALAGLQAGASVVDVVVNGLGDKAGISALEEVVMALEVLYGVPTGIKKEQLFEVSKLVEEIFNIPLAANKAIVGENIVRHQIDSHMGTILKGVWWAWEGFQPQLFGRRRALEWAKGKIRSGRSGSLAAKLEKLGVQATDEQFSAILDELKRAVERQNMVTEQDLEVMIGNVAGK